MRWLALLIALLLPLPFPQRVEAFARHLLTQSLHDLATPAGLHAATLRIRRAHVLIDWLVLARAHARLGWPAPRRHLLFADFAAAAPTRSSPAAAFRQFAHALTRLERVPASARQLATRLAAARTQQATSSLPVGIDSEADTPTHALALIAQPMRRPLELSG